MLFDVNPKERKEDFYDREKELDEILEALKLNERLIVVYGIRRIGKSSLVRVAMQVSELPYVVVDVREIYYSENVVTPYMLMRYVVEGLKNRLRWYEKVGFNLREALRKIRKIHISGYEVELEPAARVPLTNFLSEVNSWCVTHGVRFVVVFDEAQYLRYSNVRYDGLLAWAIDNLSNTTFILTGSEVGLLREFLRVDDPEAPLFGRYRREVLVSRFSREQSTGFLIEGFKELNIGPSTSEIEEAVEMLDGIVGWLTLYGYYRAVRKLPHKEALSKVFSEGSRLILSELGRVVAPSRRRYVSILKAVAHGMSSWSEIKAYVIARTGTISDKRFTELLKKLMKYGYIAKDGDRYVIPDPIVRHVAANELQA